MQLGALVLNTNGRTRGESSGLLSTWLSVA